MKSFSHIGILSNYEVRILSSINDDEAVYLLTNCLITLAIEEYKQIQVAYVFGKCTDPIFFEIFYKTNNRNVLYFRNLIII